MSDLQRLFAAGADVSRWKAEQENASARLELARAAEARAYLLSQHEPIASLEVDREQLRVLLGFTVHHDKARLDRELAELKASKEADA